MRHLIYLLLVANLVFFGWHVLQLQKQDEMVRALPALPVTATRLVTLPEMEQRQQQELAAEAETASESEPESALESESEPQLQVGSSLDPEILDPAKQLGMVESLTKQQPPGGGGAITCRTLGPIMAVAQLKSLTGKLDELGLEPRHRTYETQESTGYWIYLLAMEYSEAQAITRILDEHGDKEYYIGEENMISLGRFKEASRAERRMRQLSKLGLAAVLEPRFKIETVHWLDIDRNTSEAVDLRGVMGDYPGVRLQEQACY